MNEQLVNLMKIIKKQNLIKIILEMGQIIFLIIKIMKKKINDKIKNNDKKINKQKINFTKI